MSHAYIPTDLQATDFLIKGSLSTWLEQAAEQAKQAHYLEQVFFYGYQVALKQSFGHLTDNHVWPMALCVNEHPKAKRATFRSSEDGWIIDGEKNFVTSSDVVQTVIVSAHEASNPKDTRLFLIPATESGLQISTREEVSVFPRMAQGRLNFEHLNLPKSAMLKHLDYQNIKAFGCLESVTIASMLCHWLSANSVSERHGSAYSKLAEDFAVIAAQDFSLAESVLSCKEPGEGLNILLKQEQALGGYSRYPEAWKRDIRLFGTAGKLWDQRYKKAKASQIV